MRAIISAAVRENHITALIVGATGACALFYRDPSSETKVWGQKYGEHEFLPSALCDAIPEAPPRRKSSILFLGSGSSTGTPHPYFIMKPPEHFFHSSNKDLVGPHEVSMKAAQGNPADNKDYRCNPSILIRYRGGDFSGEKNILVDCGKTFRESVIRWFPRHKVSSVDAVLISHGHADAIFGLDDIRGLQDRRVIAPMPIYLSAECMQAIRRVLFYLVPDPAKMVPGASRAVSSLSWLEVPPNEPLDVLGLEVTPFNVMHGEDMTSFGFLFGEKERVCYISDISRMLPQSLELIKQRPIDLLVVDALLKEGKYFSHYNLTEAIALIREVRPRRALLTGMSSQFDHEATNAELRKYLKEEGLDIQLSYDGLSIDIDL